MNRFSNYKRQNKNIIYVGFVSGDLLRKTTLFEEKFLRCQATNYKPIQKDL